MLKYFLADESVIYNARCVNAGATDLRRGGKQLNTRQYSARDVNKKLGSFEKYIYEFIVCFL